MYVTEKQITAMAERYGQPERADFSFETSQEEYDRIRASQKNGRRHDITMYILKDDRLVVIAKPFYPEGLFRAPSGGLHPGEDFEVGARREALEETGCEIRLEKFLLQSEVEFRGPTKSIHWVSYVFRARYVAGDFDFTDRQEIREVGLAKLSEFKTFGRIMRAMDVAGLHYRAALHEAVEPLLTAV
jgi:ADP-ribose pyrophosphatase YjhB (NUDIX family)